MGAAFSGFLLSPFLRNKRGGSLYGVLIALAVLAAVGSTTAFAVKNRLDSATAAREELFGGFLSHFNRVASVQAAAHWSDPNFRASSLAGSFTLTEGSTETVTVTFEGCVTANNLLHYNTLSTSDIDALDAEMTAETPAQSINDGTGQTGGVLLDEIYARRFDGETRLFRYQLTGPTGTHAHITYIPGAQLSGGSQCL